MAKIYRKFEFPKDVATILKYLYGHGIVMCTEATVVNMYREFCDECYSASWLNPDADVLEHFSNWLAEYDW